MELIVVCASAALTLVAVLASCAHQSSRRERETKTTAEQKQAAHAN